MRDDDQPHRGSPGTVSRTEPSGATATIGSPNNPSPGGNGNAQNLSDHGPTTTTSYESDATIVLADVVDSTTLDSLSRAQHSGDPTQRAAAAKLARDAVANRLAQLRAKRAAIEARAQQLRKHSSVEQRRASLLLINDA